MAQEFTIKSQQIEDKINQLLPSQGGFQAGVDFSASTMVIPIVDLTETAEGSSLRQDLQTSFSHTNISYNVIVGTTTTLVNTTGYYRVFGSAGLYATTNCSFAITDGFTSKTFITYAMSNLSSGASGEQNVPFDFMVKLEAGDSLTGTSTSGNAVLFASTRQIADINGNLINP